jgi:phosphohistidine phosphatase
MRRLVLLRHGKAAREAGGGDKERALTRRGREDAARVGQFLLEHHITPNLAVASDARRTRETLDCVVDAMGRRFKVMFDPELYLAEESTLLVEFHKTPDIVQTMLVVGHNPGLAEFAFRMSGSGDMQARARLDMKYPTSGLTILEFDSPHWATIGWGAGKLIHFITPSMLSEDAEDSD